MSAKIFIIEGPDRTGKTTLAKYIAKHAWRQNDNVVYFHCDFTKPLSEAMFDYQSSVLKNMLWNYEHLDSVLIIDRLWPSNVVYRRVVDNQPAHDWTDMQHQLRRLGAVYIFGQCKSAAARHAKDRDPDHSYTDAQFSLIEQGYRNVYQDIMCSDNCMHYDLDVWGSKLKDYMGELGI